VICRFPCQKTELGMRLNVLFARWAFARLLRYKNFAPSLARTKEKSIDWIR